jgi:phage terminase small subunit
MARKQAHPSPIAARPVVDPALARLSPEALALRTRLLEEFVLDDAVAHALLQSAMESFTAIREAEAVIAKHGIVVADRWGQLRPNPAVAAERSARQAYLRALKLLGVTDDAPGPVGRPAAPK